MTDFAMTDAGFEGWAPRWRLTLDQARARSRFMRRFRVACVAVALGAVLAVVGSMTMHAVGGGFAGRRDVGQAEALRMLNPRFTGRDADGTAFVITADTAVRLGPDSPIIELSIPRYNGAVAQQIDARRGRYNTETGEIELFDDVQLEDSSGGKFATTYAKVLSRTNVIRGETPIVGSGPLGEVRGEAYEIDTVTGRLKITGRVRGRIAED
jgi:lipopolysaccharide export system protein LptC